MAHAGDPGAKAGDGALERLDLANMAAGLTFGQPIIKPVDAMLVGISLHGLGLRMDQAQAPAIATLYPLKQRVGLFGQATGVDAEDIDLRDLCADQVGKHHRLSTQTIGIGDGAEVT